MKTIVINQNNPQNNFITFGEKYLQPSQKIDFFASISEASNHQLSFTLDNTQEDKTLLDLVVNYRLYLYPNQDQDFVEKGSVLVKQPTEINFQNLIENKRYELILEYGNPYFPSLKKNNFTINAMTTNSNVIDLSLKGDQEEERDNLVSLEIPLGDDPESISIEITNIQNIENTLVKLNLREKEPNQLCKIEIRNIPSGLFNLTLFDKNQSLLEKTYNVTKYDRGATITTEITSTGWDKNTNLINLGEIKLSGGLVKSGMENASSLGQPKERRNRRAAASFLMTSGSFGYSAGMGNRAGND